MSDYYIPNNHRKLSAASSQSSGDDEAYGTSYDSTAHSSNSANFYRQRSANFDSALSVSSADEDVAARGSLSSNISYEGNPDVTTGMYSKSKGRKRSAMSSQSSYEETVPAKRAYTSGPSFDNNLDTSSQSEADASQLSENAATTESDSESDLDDPSRNDHRFEGGANFSTRQISMEDLSYRTGDNTSANIMGGGGVAAKLMAQMGYQSGTGLGKHAQGRVDPVEASKQKGRRGLGMAPSNFELDEQLAWREEQVSCKETIEWMPPQPDLIPDIDDLRSWISIGTKKHTIDNETEFVHEDIIERVLSNKSVFDELEGEEMRKARTHSNPFELIRGVMFQNRAAMKMANIDAAFNFMFTSPKDSTGANVVKSGELLYFADICAGPGGFSEYVLWRRKWKCKGFGLTLKSGPGVNDFKLDEFFVSPSECFEPHYGVGGLEGDGDIYRQDNIDKFAAFVKENSQHRGVHFVMADGGFSVEGRENVQEVLSKRLYMCQFLCAIAILRDGGHFVCKLFDIFTPFSVGLIYLIRYVFEEVCVMKPVTSRPANSERYIVCKGYKSGPGDILRLYLSYINEQFEKVNFGTTLQKKCVQHIVPLDVLRGDEAFFDYIYKSNCDLGQQQCLNLKKIQVYAKNPELRDERQMDIRAQCLELWKVPDKLRSAPDKMSASEKEMQLLGNNTPEKLGATEPSDIDEIKSEIKSIYDYKVVVSGTQSPSMPPTLYYFLSMGRAAVFKWDGVSSSRWQRASDDDNCRLQLDIPKDTIFVAEIVQELKGEGKGQRRLFALHITDVLFLYGEDFRPYSYNARLEAAQTFVTAITRPSRTRLTPIRVKQLYKIEELPSLLSHKLDYKSIKGSSSEPKLCYMTDFHNQDSCCHLFTGLFFIPNISKPWTMSYSRSNRRKYLYNMGTKDSKFTCNEAFANVSYSLAHRKLLIDKKVKTRVGLGDLTVDLDDWINSLAPWLTRP